MVNGSKPLYRDNGSGDAGVRGFTPSTAAAIAAKLTGLVVDARQGPGIAGVGAGDLERPSEAVEDAGLFRRLFLTEVVAASARIPLVWRLRFAFVAWHERGGLCRRQKIMRSALMNLYVANSLASCSYIFQVSL